jgi:Phage terminase large subunit (GpA)
VGGYTTSEYADGKLIEGESDRFLTVDVQRDHFWTVIRAWRRDNSSRLLFAGRLVEWSQIEELQKRYNVYAPSVALDAGDRQGEVYAFTGPRGYCALIGDSADDYAHAHYKTGETSRRFYSPLQSYQVSYQVKATFMYWSNWNVKNILASYRAGKIANFEIPSDVSQDYMQQMVAEKIVEKINHMTGQKSYIWKRIGNRANHLWDCECMQIVMALSNNVLDLSRIRTEE